MEMLLQIVFLRWAAAESFSPREYFTEKLLLRELYRRCDERSFFHKLSFKVAWLRKMCICVLSKICSFIDREQTKGVFTNFKMKIRVRNRRTSLDPSRKSSVWRAGEEIPFRSLSHGRADTGSLSHRWATAESLLHKREYFNRRTSLNLCRVFQEMSWCRVHFKDKKAAWSLSH